MRSGFYYTINKHKKSYFTFRNLAVVLALATLGLAGCAGRSDRAPVTDLTQGSKPVATMQSEVVTGSHVVRPGDTAYSISKSNNMEVTRLLQINQISDPSQLKVGQVLRVENTDPGARTIAITAPMPATESTETAPTEQTQEQATQVEESSQPSSEAMASTGQTATAVSSSEPQRASDANMISWGWPSDGKIIQSFNESTKGIDLEGNTGDPVNAAANGKVMYAGNGVKGLGNLILLGHTDGFITAYAHNQELLVQTGQEVNKGAKIATLGSTDTTSPRLHFEIRRRGNPVNPLSYLPVR